jgi:threonine synthase
LISIWTRYYELLGVENKTVSLGEGDTPLLPASRIGASLGFERLYFKLESLNPTGSFKDRFIALEIASMLERQEEICIATSSGNTGSSLAAYAARYGIRCYIFVGDHTPEEKLRQMLAHGAEIYRVRQFASSAEDTMFTFSKLQHCAEQEGFRLIVSAFRYSPYGMRGVKTIAYEIAEQLDRVDHVFIPVGGGGLITAIWLGFKDLSASIKRLPKIHAVQADGCPTVVEALHSGSNTIKPVVASTQISGLAVPCDVDGSLALSAIRESGGWGFSVTDEEVWQAQALLCQHEGIYAEPAGATALAGFFKAFRQGFIPKHENAVCIVTGHGFKDLTSIDRMNMGSTIKIIDREQIIEILHSRFVRSEICHEI